ncbi:MAG TPA: GNAT family N-acetyltransferase [Gemmatimonas sp.]|nr:GNAT family N-acetyltransferase [Gemmatimonas sp.]
MSKADGKRRFSCGKPAMDNYFRNRAWSHHQERIARVFVFEEIGIDGTSSEMLGFFSLASSEISRERLSNAFTGSLPKYPLPVFYVGYFAVSIARQKQGLGRAMMRDVIRRCVAAADNVGALGVYLDSLDDDSTRFYSALGFLPIPRDPARPDDPRQPMLLPMRDLIAAVPAR